MHKEFCWVQLNKPENIRCPGVLHYSVFSAWDSGLNLDSTALESATGWRRRCSLCHWNEFWLYSLRFWIKLSGLEVWTQLGLYGMGFWTLDKTSLGFWNRLLQHSRDFGRRPYSETLTFISFIQLMDKGLAWGSSIGRLAVPGFELTTSRSGFRHLNHWLGLGLYGLNSRL